MSRINLQCLKMLCDSAWCFVLFLFILLALTKDKASALELRRPATDFSRHSIVRPTLHHARDKREILSSRDSSGAHHAELTLKVDVDGVEHVLDLRLNEDLVPDNHIITYQKNGETVRHKPKRKDLDICQYSGSIRGKKGSWAAVSTCRGLRGVIYDGERMRYIEPAQVTDGIGSNHYVYDHGDLVRHGRCGYRGGVTNNTAYDPHLHEAYRSARTAERSRIARYKRDADASPVRGPYNANRLSRYVELVLVADHREYQANDEDIDTVHHQLKDVANVINALYAPLNIFVVLVGVDVWSERDRIHLDEDGDSTLTRFLEYRRQILSVDMPNDNAQLITRQSFKDGVVGKALKGPICTFEFSGGVSTNHSEVLALVAATIAHEMGHNFGMEHDNEEDCECPADKCIMSPSSTSVTPTHWSSCSLKSLALAFEKGMDYCLRNKPRRAYGSPTCGNGLVEAGEQCDCGVRLAGGAGGAGRGACAACCAPDCSLRANATCATGACCDLTTCRPRGAGAECRGALQECDLPEYCSGHSEFCPDDVYKMDATACDGGKAYCVRGACRSHTEQCRLLWGSTGQQSHGNCYRNLNVKGTKHGNCGYDRLKKIYRPCAGEDAMCGMLHCRHLNEQLEFGMESVAQLSHTFININGTIMPCRAAIIDLGLGQVDPGLVPDGAKCGDDKMCVNQKCVTVASVLHSVEEKSESVCPSDCSGHGLCNSEGHCHCDKGYAPPLCHLPGVGGSVDSGPATDPSVQKNFMVAMYVIFLGILPSLLLIAFLFYYSKHNVLIWWKGPRKSMQSPKKNSIQKRLSRGASKFAANFHAPHAQSAAPPAPVHTVSSDDMSSSLLRSDSDRSPTGNVNPSANLFGNFKGFSLTPIERNKENEQSAPEIVTVNKSAKITPVHRSGSNSQIINQSVLKPVLRTAPPLPVVPATAKQSSPKTSPSLKRANSSVQNRIKALIGAEKIENSPVMGAPPSRPVISSPILEASTCTAKELISPLQGFKTLGPVRTAPSVPIGSPELPKRPLSMHGNVFQKPLPEEPKKVREGISLNRIASFLKHDKPKEKERNPVERSHSLPKNPNHQVRIPKTDKVGLRNLLISNPILQREIELPVNTVPVVSDSEDGEDSKAFMARAQSMRGPPVSQKPVIQSFGSMRQPSGVGRPTSVAGRPTAPPPPLPNQEVNGIYKNPKPIDMKSNDYVDCIEEKQAPLAHIDEESGDNIYAIIEESPQKPTNTLPGGVVPPPIKTIPQIPPNGYNAPKAITSNSGSTESMGLLGEIVDEIQSRNFDSIYSALTLSRKKKDNDKGEGNRDSNSSTYANTDHYKTPDSVYSNSGAKSSAASTTSSGYLHPSAVNVPTYLKKEPEVIKAEAEEKHDGPDKTPPSPKGPNSKIPTFTRQITPPTLKNTSSFKNVPSSPKNPPKTVTSKALAINSPDLVSSCTVADTKNPKPPDVINNNKTNNELPKFATKPTTNKPSDNNKPPLRPAPAVEKKPTVKIQNTTPPRPINHISNINKSQADKNIALKVSSKVDSNVKALADTINKNKPKIVPKPSTINVHRTDSSAGKSVGTKLTSKPSNVASLQQKFENRKSVGRETVVKK